jgi:hypothetical protein
MRRAWPKVTIAALVAGAAIAVPLAGLGSADASAKPTISIAATTNLKVVTGDSFVVYHDTALDTAKLHGTVANGANGEVAALYAQQFPFKKAAVRVASITLKTAKTAYSFTVTPSLATHYSVRLFANAKASSPVASSAEQSVYVATDQSITAPQKCGRPVCHESFTIDTYVPAAALGTEMGKHVYPYFGINLGTSTVPPAPTWLYLNNGDAKVTASRKLSANEFANTLTFSFTIGSHSFNWLPSFCTKDAVTTDGLGLPGAHGCGTSRIPADEYYLG